jgi:hypothetical protein
VFVDQVEENVVVGRECEGVWKLPPEDGQSCSPLSQLLSGSLIGAEFRDTTAWHKCFNCLENIAYF